MMDRWRRRGLGCVAAVASALVVSFGASGCVDEARAASYFVCDCSAGSDPDCVAGSDGNSGRSPAEPWQSYERARVAFAALAPGESIRFCRGGSFTVGFSSRWVNGSCTAERPCVVRDYVPRWGSGDEPRPIIKREGASSPHGFALENGGAARHEEGYVFRNLDLRCEGGEPGSERFGFFLYNDVDDVLIDNVHIEGFDVGVHLAGANDCDPGDAQCDGRNERITLSSSTVIGNVRQGWLGSSNGSTIENSRFESNGSVALFDHNIYIGDSAGPTSGMRVAGNRLYRSAVGDDGRCAGVSLVVHGVHSAMTIEGNTVFEDPGAAANTCWGISVDPGYAAAESFASVVIRGNRVFDVGEVGIGLAACTDCVIESNVVAGTQDFGARGIVAPVRASGSGDGPMRNVSIRNNSVYIAGDSGTNRGIVLGGEGSGHELLSNAVVYAGNGRGWACFETDLDASAYELVDHNVCDYPESAVRAGWGRGPAARNRDLALWRERTGFDEHSKRARPEFADYADAAYDLSIHTPGCALVGAGHPDRSSARDISGALRDGRPDAGASEWGAQPEDRRLPERKRRLARLTRRLRDCEVAHAHRRAGREIGVERVLARPAPKAAKGGKRRPIVRLRLQLARCVRDLAG